MDVLAVVQERLALLERRALGAAVSTRHRSHVGLDRAGVGALALHRGEGGEDGGVVGLRRVRVVGERLARRVLVERSELLLEVVLRRGTGDGALGAGQGALVEVLRVVRRVAVGHVDLRLVALRDELRDDRLRLVEGEDDDRVGLRGQGRGHLGRERGLAGRELLALALAAVDDLATRRLDRSLNGVAEAGAVRVVEDQEGDLGVAVTGHELAERGTLHRVRRCGPVVVRGVAGEVGRGVRGRDLDDAVARELVDDVSVTDEDSAPIATGTFALTSFVAAELDTVMSLLSPESVAGSIVTSLSRTPPAALMSLTARPTPDSAGGLGRRANRSAAGSCRSSARPYWGCPGPCSWRRDPSSRRSTPSSRGSTAAGGGTRGEEDGCCARQRQCRGGTGGSDHPWSPFSARRLCRFG